MPADARCAPMDPKKTPRRGKAPSTDEVPENAIARYEPEFEGKTLLSPDRLTERLRRALEAADGSVQRASRLGTYRLSTIQLTCSLKAGFVVLDIGGALTLSWTLPKPTA